MSRRSRSRRAFVRSPRRLLWVVLGITAFLVADAVLITIAVGATAPGPLRTPGPIPTFGTGSSSAPSTASATPVATPALGSTPGPTAAAVAGVPRFIAVVSASVAWRATQGSCPSRDAVIERSTDAGATWQPLTTGKSAVHELLSLSGVSVTQASVVGKANANCAIGYYSSFTGGQFWAPFTANLAGATYVDLSDPARIHTSAGLEAAPCATVRQIAVRPTSTAVLCNGEMFERTAARATWVRVPVSGALAMAETTTGYTLAVGGGGVVGCPGISIQSLSSPIASAKPTIVGCLAAETAPSDVAIDQAGNILWLWSGGRVHISQDGGATWNQ